MITGTISFINRKGEKMKRPLSNESLGGILKDAFRQYYDKSLSPGNFKLLELIIDGKRIDSGRFITYTHYCFAEGRITIEETIKLIMED